MTPYGFLRRVVGCRIRGPKQRNPPMNTTPTSTPRTAAPKDRARAIWAAGDYTRVADELIPSLGPALLDAVGDVTGERLADVAAGSGNVSIPAAKRGARVVASDIVPQLLDAGRTR